MNRLGIQGCKEKCPLVRTWHGSELAGLALDWTELDSFAAWPEEVTELGVNLG